MLSFKGRHELLFRYSLETDGYKELWENTYQLFPLQYERSKRHKEAS